MSRRKPPEITFQQHIADFLVREHRYGVLEQADITDTEHFIAEDQLWAFLKATQADTLKKLGMTTARMRGTRSSRLCARNWSTRRFGCSSATGLKVRGLEFRLYYPKPRSAESAAATEIRREPHHLPPAFLLWGDQPGN